MAVYYVFPMFMISVRAAKGVILFKRGRQFDKEVSRLVTMHVICSTSDDWNKHLMQHQTATA